MTNKLFYTLTAVIFSAVAIMHILRLVYGWEALIGGFMVPMWVSYIGIIIGGFLAYTAIKIGSKK